MAFFRQSPTLLYLLFVAYVCAHLLAAPASRRPITLPIEVAGADGTSQTVSVDLPEGAAQHVRSLWIHIHGIEYPDMVSVRVNESPWVSLNNKTVSITGPGASYGGIGGAVSTLKLTLSLPPNSMLDGTNHVQFRFNRTNGVVSGFRILAFNFLLDDGQPLLPPTSFREDDPASWQPPLPDAASISAGRELWHHAPLLANGLPGAAPIRAHCSDCHTADGRDLKYFAYSNASIIARSRFHGLSDLAARQIASYIRSLPFASPGRPWNPPYQPGPGLDSRPAANWAAGAGLAYVLDNESDSLSFLFAKDHPATLAIRPSVFAPDANLNPREIPIAFPLPDWNHWLPRIHPLDAFGKPFEESEFARLYSDSDYTKPAAADGLPRFFDYWTRSRNRLLPRPASDSKKWSPALMESLYSAELWQLVKTWEIVQDYHLEESQPAIDRAWPNTVPSSTAPDAVNIPDNANGMGGSALTNEFFNNAWYELQLILNTGGHRHHGKAPVDWVYIAGHFRDLAHLSNRPESARLLIAVVKAMQSTDPQAGPENTSEGWRPDQSIDPRIMVASGWADLFSALSPNVRRAITEAMLQAWLDKTLQYPADSYFHTGLPNSYAPGTLQDIWGGKVWELAPQFAAAGVNPQLVRRLEAWGRTYTNLAQLFHY